MGRRMQCSYIDSAQLISNAWDDVYDASERDISMEVSALEADLFEEAGVLERVKH